MKVPRGGSWVTCGFGEFSKEERGKFQAMGYQKVDHNFWGAVLGPHKQSFVGYPKLGVLVKTAGEKGGIRLRGGPLIKRGGPAAMGARGTSRGKERDFFSRRESPPVKDKKGAPGGDTTLRKDSRGCQTQQSRGGRATPPKRRRPPREHQQRRGGI